MGFGVEQGFATVIILYLFLRQGFKMTLKMGALGQNHQWTEGQHRIMLSCGCERSCLSRVSQRRVSQSSTKACHLSY